MGDTEYACSLQCIAQLLHQMHLRTPSSAYSWPLILAYMCSAVVACEAITGEDHAEATFYREILVLFLDQSGDSQGAEDVSMGEQVVPFDADVSLLKGQA